jgi:hypothetical protein
MILTAQRVVASSGNTGINVYCHADAAEGSFEPGASSLDRPRGKLIAQTVAVPPPGNNVRSFLDIAAPDDATAEELGAAFEAFVAAHGTEDLPWVGQQDRCAFRLGMDDSLASEWRKELAALLNALAGALETSDDATVQTSA